MQFDIRRFDIYRKIPKDLTQPTNTGAAISLACISFISTLLLIELYYFITPEVASELFVDIPESGHADRIPVHIDITVLNIGCQYVGIDIQDDLGRHEVGFIDNTLKTPENNGAGCRINASFKINRVPGNFHISTHSASSQPTDGDMKHVIHELTFGDTIKGFRQIPNRKAFHPLRRFNNTNRPSHASHDYLLKIVPTIYEDLGSVRRYPYQFTFFYRVSIRSIPIVFSSSLITRIILFPKSKLLLSVRYFAQYNKLFSDAFGFSICRRTFLRL
ncbi:unnamed protein product [Adineta steineri]|uniref:Uncharacterized protein n=1 Tax=Adineta steineri TaxID=433720 RepID=A0A820BUH0_9BILA|nr:unnamed protein product [Adineta steineri]